MLWQRVTDNGESLQEELLVYGVVDLAHVRGPEGKGRRGGGLALARLVD
jgi:hypothetical protein